jgi:predicted metal-dependent RNase
MNVQTIDGYSGHSDRAQLLAYVRNIRPKPTRILAMHGEESKCEDLTRTLNKMMRVETRAPMNLDSMRLR